MKNILILSLLFCTVFPSFGQNPAAASTDNAPIAIINAEIYTGTGNIIKSGVILIEKGKIKAIGNNDILSGLPNLKTINASGKRVYPGIISPNNSLGLTEIEAVRTTSDYQELGQYNPNIRSLIAYNTDSEIIPTVRGNGVLITQATPEGGIISGRSSIMNLDGWNYEDAALLKNDGLWINWPSKITNSFNFQTFTREKKKNENYAIQINELGDYFSNAIISKSISKTQDNLKYAALADVLNSAKARVYFKFDSNKEVFDILEFITKHKVKNAVLAGAVSAELALTSIKDKNIPVLLPTTHRLPESDDAELWEAYKLPKKLFDKGILTGMYYNESYWRTRNLPFAAGNAAAHGLTPAEALQMVTSNNAKILGIDHLVGTIEVGKDATLVISAGDILDMRTSKVEQVFIKGAAVNLDDKQKRLSEKYHKKYNIK